MDAEVDAENWPRAWAGDRMTRRQGMDRWGVAITGTGSALPGEPISNDELLRRHPLPTTAEWVESHTGIVARHHAAPDEATSDHAAVAGRRACEAAGIAPTDLERILLATTTGDWTSPAAANRVQQLMGAECPALDLQTACASWIYSLELAARLVATRLAPILVVGADTKSRFVRADDHRLYPVLAADGAAAVVVDRHDGDDGILQLELYSDGAMHRNVITPAGGSAIPASHDSVDRDLHSARMTIPGQQIKAHGVWLMSNIARQVLAQEGLTIDDVDWFIPHQANRAIMLALIDELGLPEHKLVSTIEHTGNIVAATVPYAFDAATRDGRFRPGDLVLLSTAGAGYSAGAALYRVPRHAAATS